MVLGIPFSKFQPVQLEQVPLLKTQLWFYNNLVPWLHFPNFKQACLGDFEDVLLRILQEWMEGKGLWEPGNEASSIMGYPEITGARLH